MPTSPAVTFVMEPVLPGRYAVLTVGGADDATRVFAHLLPNAPPADPGAAIDLPGPAVALPIIQRTDETITVDIPTGHLAAYAISLSQTFDAQNPVIVNRPRLDWALPPRGTPGGELRLFGRNLANPDHYPASPASPPEPRSYGGMLTGRTRVVARHRGSSAVIELPVERSSGYEAHLRLPIDLKPGDYDLFAHNGLGGTLGWSEALPIKVSAPAAAWPTGVILLDDLIDGGLDTDAAFVAALATLESSGGGILQLGHRTYGITRTLVLPPRTILRGQGCERTMIRLPLQGELRRPFVAITGDRDFVVEDLRIESVYAAQLIVAPRFLPATFEEAFAFGNDRVIERTRNVTVQRCHLVQRPLSHLDRRGDRDFAKWVENQLRIQGAQSLGAFQAIQVAGDEITIADNLIIGGGGCVGLNRCRWTRIAGNTLKAGPAGTALTCYSRLIWPPGDPGNPGDPGDPAQTGGAEVKGSYCRQIVIEDNDVTVHSEHARNLVSLMFGGEDLYVARNHIHDIEPTTDAEALLTHLWSARWKEPKLAMTGPTTGRIIDPTGEVKHECLDGACIEIVAGRGTGQMRRIVKRDGDTIEIDKPFRVDPDSTSMTVFTAPPAFWRLAFVDNRVVSSAVNIIVWGNSSDVVVDGNYTADGPGITIWSVRFKGDQKVWGGAAFTSVINNTVDRGWSSPAKAEHVLGGGVGIMILCSLDATCTADGYDILGLVVRNNLVLNNTGISMRVTFPMESTPGRTEARRIHDSGIVVEANHCRDTVVGVAIEKGAHAIERGNTFENVRFPLVWGESVVGR